MNEENEQSNDKQGKSEDTIADSKLPSEFNKRLSEFIDIVRKKPVISL